MRFIFNIKNKIILGSSPFLVLVVTLAFLAYHSIESLLKDANWVKHTHEVISNTSTIEKLVIDMETGERGFLIAGKEEFLEPYNSGEKELSTLLQETRDLISDNPAQIEKLKIIEQTIGLWQKNAAIPEIEKRREVNQRSSTMEDVISLIEKGAGKRIMDDIRAQLQAFKQVEYKLLAARKLESERGILTTQYVIIWGTVLILVSSLIWSLWFAGSISSPLRILKDVSDSISKGIYPEKINIHTKDEIADLGKTFESMIDKIKTNEQALLLKKEEAETANQAKSIFLANMSHEIRTPLNAVLGYAQILQRDSSLNDEQLDAIKTINKSGNHLLGLINDILDISTIESGKQSLNLDEFDLGALANELQFVFSAECKRKQLLFKMDDYPEGEVFIYGDLGKLRQILINLLGNAVKFTDSGSVEFRYSQQGQDSRFMFEVIDTGQGIPMNAQESIFEPFKQENEGLKKGGTGLGLAISHKQVRQMGGELLIDSEAGRGARFHFTIPLERRSKARIENQNTKFAGVTGLKAEYKIKALVVDDVKENRDVLSLFLKSIGVAVTQAEDGKIALEQIEIDEPHIVFMDIRMPVMDGVEAFHKIKKQYPQKDIKIICITASTLQHQQQKYIDIGFDAYVSKPFQHSDILSTLETYLNVKYDYEDQTETVVEESNDIDWSKFIIPSEIKTRILNSADLYTITSLEKACGQLESVENGGKELAQLLRKLLQSYDMNGIISAINKTG